MRPDPPPRELVPANPDPKLEAKLRGEAPGILRWMIDGLSRRTGAALSRAANRPLSGQFSRQKLERESSGDDYLAQAQAPDAAPATGPVRA
jgi:hypothetical protein